MKKHMSTLILVVLLLLGVSLLLYPTVSDYWNNLHQTKAIAGYVQSINNITEERFSMLLHSAEAYNRKIAFKGINFRLSDSELKEYDNMLNIDNSGIMGYVEISSIGCCLPIYHGTDESTLQIAVGHIAGSSLPIGGESTHCVLSGHRGLPSAKIFSNLDKLSKGDCFVIQTLKQTLTYEVDQILTVTPTDVSALSIENGSDFCTLVTCTPYGINTHRLLVRGHRVDNNNSATVRIASDAVIFDTAITSLGFATPILIVIVFLFIISVNRKTKRNMVRKKLGITHW